MEPENHHNNSSKTSSSHQGHKHKHNPNPTQLLSSAKLVAEAAKSTLHPDMAKIDKPKVAGAAADLLGAASHYGKLEEKSFGKYVEKAENYLHQYHTSHSSTTVHASSGVASATAEHSGHSSAAHSDGGKQSDSGFGDYLKLAEGFLKKH